MYILYYKKPVAIREGKSGYVMSWRGQQIAMCEDIKPLQAYINAHTDKSAYFIEEQPNRD